MTDNKNFSARALNEEERYALMMYRQLGPDDQKAFKNILKGEKSWPSGQGMQSG